MGNPVHIEVLNIEIERLTQENKTLAGYVVELKNLAQERIPASTRDELHEFLERRKRQIGVDSTYGRTCSR